MESDYFTSKIFVKKIKILIKQISEVQLKPHHRPYEVRKRWMTLLQRFAHESDEETMQADEPAMFFRRNVNLSQDREIAVGFLET